MTSKRTLLLKSTRDQMISVLRSGFGYSQRELQEKIHRDAAWDRNHSGCITYVLVGECVRIYDREFYRDPATGRIFLTRHALVMERVTGGRTEESAGQSEENSGDPGFWKNPVPRTPPAKTFKRFCPGTAGSRIAEAMEAREA